jgi:2-dehydro-3-deoxyphosphogluconate aldolase/(4S)-4-hydroxy-2-oxoglutarate aldolase
LAPPPKRLFVSVNLEVKVLRDVPTGIIAVVRAVSMEQGRTIVSGLARAGVDAIEITMTVPSAISLIEEFRNSGTLIGAGTVLTVDQCHDAIAAGATFIVAPSTNVDVLGVSHAAGVAYIGGALTPSEVEATARAGSDAVKIFPVSATGGPNYLKALREPFPDLRAVVSGGVSLADVAHYVAAGAHAVCLGGAIIDREAAERSDVNAVAKWAREILSATRSR